MLTGRTPFRSVGGDRSKLVRILLACRFTVPDYVPVSAATLIHMCLKTSPCDRATVQELCETDFLRGAEAIASVVAATDGSERIECKDDGSDAGQGRWLMSALRLKQVRRVWTLALYSGLCALALWFNYEALPPEEQ